MIVVKKIGQVVERNMVSRYQALRSYASLLRKITKNELREEKSRPRVYIEWMKKVTSKVFV
jgi:hypothetical protein